MKMARASCDWTAVVTTGLVALALSPLGCENTERPSSGCADSTCVDRGGSGGTGTQGGGGGSVSGGSAGTPLLDASVGSGGSGGDSGCPDVEVSLGRTTPTVVIVIDQSNSMDLPLEPESDDMTSRWDALKSALLDTDGLIAPLEQAVRFGLVLYDNATPYFPECPDFVEIMPPTLNNFAAIEAVYGSAGTIPNTPTGAAITSVHEALQAFPEEGPRYIVLATDGDPDRCDANLGQDYHDEESKQIAVSAVQAAFEDGIGTFVMSVGLGSVTLSHLQQMANAGTGLASDADPGARYFETGSQNDLRQALSEIVGGIVTCTFEMDGEVRPELASSGTVVIDGEEIPMSDEDGWRLVSPTEIELVGPACDALKTGEHHISASFPCDAVVR